MTQQEYEQKKRECWEEFCRMNPSHNKSIFAKKTLDFAFDLAYALGKQEKDAEEVLTCEKCKVLYHFRMAEACKIGNNPESDYWIGYSKAIQDLFGLEGEPCVEPRHLDTVIQGWVARDLDGEVFLYENKPERGDGEWLGRISSEFDFQQLKWGSDPIEVELIIKRKKNEVQKETSSD